MMNIDELHDDLKLDYVILKHVSRVLELYGGNKRQTAVRLGISRSTLYRILERMDSNDRDSKE